MEQYDIEPNSPQCKILITLFETLFDNKLQDEMLFIGKTMEIFKEFSDDFLNFHSFNLISLNTKKDTVEDLLGFTNHRTFFVVEGTGYWAKYMRN